MIGGTCPLEALAPEGVNLYGYPVSVIQGEKKMVSWMENEKVSITSKYKMITQIENEMKKKGRSVEKNVWAALFISFEQETERCFWWYSRWA